MTQQHNWAVLSQGFTDSPHLLAQALEKDLRDLDLREGSVLQYVDNILICNPIIEQSNCYTIT